MKNVFHKRLRELRLREKVTTSQFARMIGVTKATVVNWEKTTLPNGKHLIIIAKHYNVSIDWLLGLEERECIFTENLTETQIASISSLIRAFTENEPE